MTPLLVINLHGGCLSEILAQIGLKPQDVGGSGDCFFMSVSHQLCGIAELARLELTI